MFAKHNNLMMNKSNFPNMEGMGWIKLDQMNQIFPQNNGRYGNNKFKTEYGSKEKESSFRSID